MLFEFYAVHDSEKQDGSHLAYLKVSSQPTQQTCAHCVTIQTLPPLSCGRAYDKTNTGSLACVFCVLTQAE